MCFLIVKFKIGLHFQLKNLTLILLIEKHSLL